MCDVALATRVGWHVLSAAEGANVGHNQTTMYVWLLVLGVAAYAGASSCALPDCIPVSEVKTLRFFKDEYTTGRRVAPEPKLQVTPSYLSRYVKSASCRQAGIDDQGQVMWDCDVVHDENYVRVLHANTVVWEGYHFSGDMDALAGSFRLRVTVDRMFVDGASDVLVDALLFAVAVFVFICVVMAILSCCEWLCSRPRYVATHTPPRETSRTTVYTSSRRREPSLTRQHRRSETAYVHTNVDYTPPPSYDSLHTSHTYSSAPPPYQSVHTHTEHVSTPSVQQQTVNIVNTPSPPAPSVVHVVASSPPSVPVASPVVRRRKVTSTVAGSHSL